MKHGELCTETAQVMRLREAAQHRGFQNPPTLWGFQRLPDPKNNLSDYFPQMAGEKPTLSVHDFVLF